MRKNLIVLLLLLLVNVAVGQEMRYSISVMPEVAMYPDSYPETIDTNKYYNDDKVERSAEPKDGWQRFHKQMDSLDYPLDAKRDKLETDIEVEYKIDRNGKLISVHAYKANIYEIGSGVNKSKDCQSCKTLLTEFFKTIEWNPATINGVRVNSRNTMIIEFSIYTIKE